MLISPDETLFHQASLSLSQTITSDHRFYDRCFVTAVDPAGSAALAVSLGIYKNMNVVDGFAALAIAGRQYNIRVSRPLRPQFQAQVHGLRYDIVAPLREIRLSLQDDSHPLAFDLHWRGTFAPMMEDRWWGTHNVVNERQAIDVVRYEQTGRVSGWITSEGRRIEVVDWFGGRDHSWGVRGKVGGYEPDTGGRLIDGRGMLLNWFLFATDELCGFVTRTEDDQGVQHGLDGLIQFAPESGRPALSVVSATVAVKFQQGSRYYQHAAIDFTTGDGQSWRLDAEPFTSAVICRGGGYDGGWNDGKGLGVYRGNCIEYDIYEDGSNPGLALVRPGGVELPHNQKEQMARIRLNGRPGFGDCTLIAFGDLPRHGLGAEVRL